LASTSLLVDYENIGKIDLAAIPSGVQVRFFFGASQKTVRTEFLMSALKLGERFVLTEISGAGPNALDFHIAYYLGEILAHDATHRCVILSKDKGFDPLVKHLVGRGFAVSRAATLADASGIVTGAAPSGRRGAATKHAAHAKSAVAKPEATVRATAAPRAAAGATGASAGTGVSARSAVTPKPPAPARARSKPAPAASSPYEKALRRLGGMPLEKRPQKRKRLVADLYSHFAKKLDESEVGKLVDQLLEDGKLTETGGVLGYGF
jgi:hypothetical protein